MELYGDLNFEVLNVLLVYIICHSKINCGSVSWFLVSKVPNF
jgi:hypothetical protein